MCKRLTEFFHKRWIKRILDLTVARRNLPPDQQHYPRLCTWNRPCPCYTTVCSGACNQATLSLHSSQNASNIAHKILLGKQPRSQFWKDPAPPLRDPAAPAALTTDSFNPASPTGTPIQELALPGPHRNTQGTTEGPTNGTALPGPWGHFATQTNNHTRAQRPLGRPQQQDQPLQQQQPQNLNLPPPPPPPPPWPDWLESPDTLVGAGVMEEVPPERGQ